MHIKILGPFEVRDGDAADVPGARLRGLLVALALRPGQVVPKAALIDWIWGEHPPADAANALQRLVSRLRKALPGAVVEGLTDGYRLAIEADAVDAVRFERLVAQAWKTPGRGGCAKRWSCGAARRCRTSACRTARRSRRRPPGWKPCAWRHWKTGTKPNSTSAAARTSSRN